MSKLDQGTLPNPVGPQERDPLAPPDRKVEIINDLERPK
jgi:hypothetical protein